MSLSILLLFLFFFALRIASLVISIRHEKRLKQAGAEEFGRTNSIVLAVLHVAFYVAAFVEGWRDKVQFDDMTGVGVALFIFSMAALYYVIYALSPIWTVKLIIAPGHRINHSPLFKYVRHPNYLLNLIPELIALTLLMKSYWVFLALFPLYLVSLGVRIYQEERVMRAKFADY